MQSQGIAAKFFCCYTSDMSDNKRERGRPPKADEERKSYMLRIRMTEQQREVLAEAAGGNISDWARDVLLRAAKRRIS
jgi:CxxC motif-containing protein (DUF1111 family)